MNLQKLKLNNFLIRQFGRRRLWTTIEQLADVLDKKNADPIDRTEFSGLIYSLLSSYNEMDLGSFCDRITAFCRTEKLSLALYLTFSGEVEAEKIVCDLSDGSLWIYLTGFNEPWNFHPVEPGGMKDLEIISVLNRQGIQRIKRIFNTCGEGQKELNLQKIL